MASFQICIFFRAKMPPQRSSSEERKKKQRQRRRWADDKKEHKKAKDRLRKREKKSLDKESIFIQRADYKKIAKPSFGREKNQGKEELKLKELSEYEIIRQNNINERLEGMVESGLWSKEEVAILKTRYLV